MVDKTAAMHIVKYEKVKVIGDDLNLAGQGFDGYTIFARVYHDVFVPDNKRVGLYCSVVEGAPMAAALDILLDEDNRIKSITTYPGEKIAYVFTASNATAASVGDAFSKLTNPVYVRVGDAAISQGVYYAVVNNVIVAKWTAPTIS